MPGCFSTWELTQAWWVKSRLLASGSRQNFKATGANLLKVGLRALQTSPNPPEPRNSSSTRSTPASGRSPGLNRETRVGRKGRRSSPLATPIPPARWCRSGRPAVGGSVGSRRALAGGSR